MEVQTRSHVVAVVGGGYVGLVTAVHLAAQGRSVTVVEVDSGRRELIAAGEAPIYEPGLNAVLARVIASGHLTTRADLAEVLDDARTVVIAVGTPPLEDGRADLRALNGVARTIAAHAQPGTIAVIKSTVPPGTGRRVQRMMDDAGGRVSVVSCPEFLREGCAFDDIQNADRFVVGGGDAAALDAVTALMRPREIPTVRTSNTAAELIKYGSNAFLAMKISFINEMANLCDLVEADVDDVARGMGLDSRIGTASMRPGLGFGGSCFPKDVAALEHAARGEGFSFWLLRSAIEVNEAQRTRFVQKIRDAVGNHIGQRRIALLGLAFKPETDDLRQAPSIAIANRLVELGATVVAHDPVATAAAAALLPEVEMFTDPYQAIAGADVVAIVTEWPEYLELDWARAANLVRKRVVVDGRNCLDAAEVAASGFNYCAMGRPRVETHHDRRSSDVAAAVEAVEAAA